MHPLSQRFNELLTELGELHAKKQEDYGRANDPFANIRGSTEWGIRPWVGALVRASDKFKRLQKFAQVGCLANEAVEDSFKDLAVYALIGLVLYEEERDSQKHSPITWDKLDPNEIAVPDPIPGFFTRLANDLKNVNGRM